jgi:hypothetical protein
MSAGEAGPVNAALTPLSDKEMARRLPLWEALSDFYLDTECEGFVPMVARVAKEGGFSVTDVEHILRWEVRPALYFNMLDMTGEWMGWDQDWLRARIIHVMGKPPPFLLCDNAFMPAEWPAIHAAMLAITPKVSSIHAPPNTRSPS